MSTERDETWHSANDGVWISIQGPDDKVCGVVSNAVDYLNDYEARLTASEAERTRLETALREIADYEEVQRVYRDSSVSHEDSLAMFDAHAAKWNGIRPVAEIANEALASSTTKGGSQ